mmetsp:Transcript_59122/g.152019  ORF Transcript_59122/g.152019 Transcript_59122/m.152019 type:complete len:293 (-) Transcript_59122:289-1167(-)
MPRPVLGALQHAVHERSHLAQVGLCILLNDVIVAGLVWEVSWPAVLDGRGLGEPLPMVEGNDLVHLPMHDKGRAADALHVPVIVEEVEAPVHTGWAAALVRLRVNHLDAREHRGVHNDATQWARGCEGQDRPTSNTLPIGHDPLSRHPLGDDVVVGSLDVGKCIARARPATARAVAGVLHAHDLATQLRCELQVRTHHHADVSGIAMTVQQDEWLSPVLRLRARRRRRAARAQPDDRDSLITACPQERDARSLRSLLVEAEGLNGLGKVDDPPEARVVTVLHRVRSWRRKEG